MKSNIFHNFGAPRSRAGWILTATFGVALLASHVSFALQTSSEISSQVPVGSPEDPGAVEPLYVLRRGDEISIKVFNHPELDETTRVRPDGRISAVLLDDIPADGLTTRELDDLLTSRYAEFYRDPRVTVIVREFAQHKVYVGGEVQAPGVIPLSGSLTALAAVMQVGGFKGTAKLSSVVLVRDNGSGKPTVQRIDLKDVLNEGAPDILLQPFDIVYVPMSNIAKVDKFVDDYIRKLIPLTLSAGFTYVLGGNAVVLSPQ